MLRLRARLGHDCWRQLGVCAGRGEAGRLGSSAAAVFLGRLRLRPSPAASARMMAGAGAVSRIVAEAMAEVDAKMLALPNPPSSPLLGSSARHLPACRGFSGLESSGRAGGLLRVLPEPRRGPGDKHHGPRAGFRRRRRAEDGRLREARVASGSAGRRRAAADEK